MYDITTITDIDPKNLTMAGHPASQPANDSLTGTVETAETSIDAPSTPPAAPEVEPLPDVPNPA